MLTLNVVRSVIRKIKFVLLNKIHNSLKQNIGN